MDLATFHELLTPVGQTALLAAKAFQPNESNFLSDYEKLRKLYSAPLAKGALDTVLLRWRARTKFPAADRMYFTREALEQSSGLLVSHHRAERFIPFGEIADLCCGIGGDSLAFAALGLSVHAVERDPLRLAMVRANAATLGLADRIHGREADAISVPLPHVRAAFADPSRRGNGRRHLHPEDYTPPLSALRGRFPSDFPLGVKIAPGVALSDLSGLGVEVEFVSVAGELKEGMLWFGPLRTTVHRATVLPTGATLFAAVVPRLPPITAPKAFVFDPDPAVVRAGLTAQLAAEAGMAPIDHEVALLTGSDPVHSPFLTSYRVELAERFHLGRLRDHLRAHHVGRITPIKRGSTIDSDELQKKLKLDGREHRVILLTRLAGEPGMITCERT